MCDGSHSKVKNLPQFLYNHYFSHVSFWTTLIFGGKLNLPILCRVERSHRTEDPDYDVCSMGIMVVIVNLAILSARLKITYIVILRVAWNDMESIGIRQIAAWNSLH